MRTLFFLLLLILSFPFVTTAQLAPDFTITDTEGVEHQLYADHLDMGQTVVLKLFFVNCPPCNGYAPFIQDLYEDWGEGQYDVEFIELSTKTFDSNADVHTYKNTHGITFPGAGNDGGGYAATAPYRNGTFGTFFGTPTFVVIAPNGEVQFDVGGSNLQSTLDALNEAISATGATGMASVSGSFSINVIDQNGEAIDTSLFSVTLKPLNSSTPSYDLIALTEGSLSFEYPSVAIPEMDEPTIVFAAADTTDTSALSTLDLALIQRHILGLSVFTDPHKLIAADINGDGKIRGADVVFLRKVVLHVLSQFPIPSLHFTQNNLSVNPNTAQPTNFVIEVVRVGDVN